MTTATSPTETPSPPSPPRVFRATPGRVITILLGVPLILAGAAWSAFSLIGVLARTSEHHQATYAWSGGPVSLNVGDGNVQIRAADIRSVEVSYTEHYQLKKPTVRATSGTNGVSLTGRCASGILGQNCSINFVITVPKQAALALHLGDGNLTLEDVTSSVDLHGGDGNVHGTDLGSPSLSANVGDGNVSLQWATPPVAVSLNAGDGNVALTVPQGSGPYAIRQSGSGSSGIQVATNPTAKNTMVLHTGDGNVRVQYGS